MSIEEYDEKGNTETVSYDQDGHILHASIFKKLFPVLLVVLVGALAFGAGRLSKTGETKPVTISYDSNYIQDASTVFGTSTPTVAPSNSNTAAVNQFTSPNPSGGKAKIDGSAAQSAGEVVASSKGKKYYYSTCKNNISDKNKVTFATKEMAESAGYTLASNCSQN